MNMYQLQFKDGGFTNVLADSVVITNDETNPGLEMYQGESLVVAIPPGGWLGLLRGVSDLSDEEIAKFRAFARTETLLNERTAE